MQAFFFWIGVIIPDTEAKEYLLQVLEEIKDKKESSNY